MKRDLGPALVCVSLLVSAFAAARYITTRDYVRAAFFVCVIIAIGLLAMLGGCASGAVECDIEDTLIERVESELGVTCGDVRPTDGESLCTGGVAVAIDREGHTALVYIDTYHSNSVVYGRITCVDECGGCDLTRGGAVH
jgi:hypothetical protein